MTANFIGILEDSLGRGVWADPVASQLARPLNAILAYLPPEGARVSPPPLVFCVRDLLLASTPLWPCLLPSKLYRTRGSTFPQTPAPPSTANVTLGGAVIVRFLSKSIQ